VSEQAFQKNPGRVTRFLNGADEFLFSSRLLSLRLYVHPLNDCNTYVRALYILCDYHCGLVPMLGLVLSIVHIARIRIDLIQLLIVMQLLLFDVHCHSP